MRKKISLYVDEKILTAAFSEQHRLATAALQRGDRMHISISSVLEEGLRQFFCPDRPRQPAVSSSATPERPLVLPVTSEDELNIRACVEKLRKASSVEHLDKMLVFLATKPFSVEEMGRFNVAAAGRRTELERT